MQRASEALDKSKERVETTGAVNLLNDQKERPLSDQVKLKIMR